MRLIRHIIFTSITLLAAAYIVPGFTVINLTAAVIASLVLGLINAIIRPIMLLLTLPINIVTLGLFTIVINALMLILTANFVGGFAISGLWPAILGSLVMSLVSSLLSAIVPKD